MVSSLQRIASGNLDPVALLRDNQQRKSKEALQAEQLRSGADLFAEGGMTPFTAIAKGLTLGAADRKEAKDQERKDKIQAEIDKITAWRQQQAEHQAEMQNLIDAGAYMQAQQPVFAQGLRLLDATGDGSALDTALRGSQNWMAMIGSKLNGADFIGTSTRTLPDGTKVIVANGRTPEGEVVGVDIIPMDQGLMNLAPEYVAQRAQEEQAKALNDARVDEVNARAGASRALEDQRRRPDAPPTASQPASKPMPIGATKLQNESISALGQLEGVNADIDGLIAMIDSGDLNTSLLSRGEAAIRNTFNASDEQSRNLSTLDSKLSNMRNAVLLLNKGVQTEGDAQRAMDEIINNKNDTALVRQRLQDLKALNQRAADLQRFNIENIRSQYNQPDLDLSRVENPRASVGTTGADYSKMSDDELMKVIMGGQ